YRPSTYVSPPGWYVCQHQPTVSEGDGYFAQFNIANGVATGITEHQSNDNGLISFPNPFGNEITFNFSVEDSKGYTIEIYNTLGQIVFTQKDQTSIGQISKTVDLGFINTGIYFVQVKLSNRILASKIVRQ
ncbi:MAG: T9SS type A sorting domain-containing protein, partial [Bacteroidia bacterium]